tara:strand:- start:414 stop:719 length:306 start_codon:yes stop_codon:yes gene_type:complete
MIKFFFTSLISILILFTAFIKNSTKRIDDEIFVTKENIRGLKKDFENVKLEHNFLSSTEKLVDFQNLYFDDELVKKNINEIKIIYKKSGKFEIEPLRFFNE